MLCGKEEMAVAKSTGWMWCEGGGGVEYRKYREREREREKGKKERKNSGWQFSFPLLFAFLLCYIHLQGETT